MGRRRPRPISEAIGSVREAVAPAGGLAAVQLRWPEVVGAPVAAVSRPVSERDGELRVNCADAVWAEELSMMEPELRERLRARLGDAAPSRIRFVVGDVSP